MKINKTCPPAVILTTSHLESFALLAPQSKRSEASIWLLFQRGVGTAHLSKHYRFRQEEANNSNVEEVISSIYQMCGINPDIGQSALGSYRIRRCVVHTKCIEQYLKRIILSS